MKTKIKNTLNIILKNSFGVKKISQILSLSALLIPAVSLAQKITIPNPLDKSKVGDSFISLITAILNNIVMPIAAIAVVMYIIYAGFTFITAQGKPAELQKARARLLWSVIGAAVLLGAAAISAVVCNTVSNVTGVAAVCGK